MKSHQAGQFPGTTIVHALVAGVSSTVPGITRGIRYRIVSDQDCWFAYNSNAVLEQGLYLPAKTPDYFAFGMDDRDGTDLEIHVIAAFNGKVYFTPLKTVPTEG